MPFFQRLMQRSRSSGGMMWNSNGDGFERLLPTEEATGIASVWPGNAASEPSSFASIKKNEYTMSSYDQSLSALARGSYAEVAPFAMKEHDVPTDECNKVFAAAWLDNDNAVLGTKDNKLLRLNMDRDGKQCNLTEIDLPRVAGPASSADPTSCGMHTCVASWDRTLLATGGASVQDIALFDTSDANNIQPLAVLRGHRDWVFAADWGQRGTLVSGSKDNQFMIWHVDRVCAAPSFEADSPVVDEVTPAVMWSSDEVIRDLKVHPNSGQSMVSLSNTGSVAVWDLTRGAAGGNKAFTTQVKPGRESVVVSVQSGTGLIAVGSQKHIHFVDPRAPSLAQKIESQDAGWGVRSLSWNEHILTVGGGFGRLSFYDMRAGTYLRDPNHSSNKFREVGDKGFLRKDEVFQTVFVRNALPTPNAVYTVSRSPSGQEVLAAGGPTPFGLYGSFISVLASW